MFLMSAQFSNMQTTDIDVKHHTACGEEAAQLTK